MKHLVQFSGGVGSWAAARRVVERHGPDDVTLLFADTLIEDADLYRFLDEAAANVGVPLVKIAEGRTPWEVFFAERFLGNSRVDPCSKILKRQMLDRWREAHCDPAETTVYVGVDWSESHRLKRLQGRDSGWTWAGPMCEPPYLSKPMMLDLLREQGIEPPRLYKLGFSHNNCGGFCIKAGIGHFVRLLTALPEVYAHHEAMEEKFRATISKNVAILRDRTKGGSRPLTLKELRERVQCGEQFDLFDIGGCGCALR